LRASWKGNFFHPKFNKFEKIDHIGNRQIRVAEKNVGKNLLVYKGTTYEEFTCDEARGGMMCSAFVHTRKYKNIHLNNRLQRKSALRKMQLKNKSKIRKMGIWKHKGLRIKEKKKKLLRLIRIKKKR